MKKEIDYSNSVVDQSANLERPQSGAGLMTSEKNPSRTRDLARNIGVSVGQLKTIIESPTVHQKDQLAQLEEGTVDTFRDSLTLHERLDQAIKEARSAALKEKDPVQFRKLLDEFKALQESRTAANRDVREAVNSLKSVGLQLEGDQVPLTVTEKASQAAVEASSKTKAGIRSGAEAVGQAYSRTRERTGEALQGGIRTVTETAKSGIETGRTAINSLMDKVVEFSHSTKSGMQQGIEQAQETARQVGEAGVNTKEALATRLREGAESLKRSVSNARDSLKENWLQQQQNFSELVTSATGILGKSKDTISSSINQGVEIAKRPFTRAVGALDNWRQTTTENLKKQLSSTAELAQTAISERTNPLRMAVGEKISGFKQGMTEVGEKIRDEWSTNTEKVKNFATEQGNRVERITKEVEERVSGEISMAVEKGKLLLAPFWEDVSKERETMQATQEMMRAKVSLLTGVVSEVASPFVDRIMDQGRDLRDMAIGFSKDQIAGLQGFGRSLAGKARESADPLWNSLHERWEDLRLRSNESRDRLNLFITGVLGEGANKFGRLRESAQARTARAGQLLSGVYQNGNEVWQNGKKVASETAEQFKEKAAAAQEFIDQSKERLAEGWETLRRYVQIYAVEHWQNAGLSDKDIKRRMKILGAAGAASMRRGMVVGTATALEGTRLAGEVLSSPRGRLAIGAAAIALYLLANPEVVNQMAHFLQGAADQLNIHLGTLQFPDLSHLVNTGINPDAGHLQGVTGHAQTVGSIPPVSGAEHLGTTMAGHTGSIGTSPNLGSISPTGPTTIPQPGVAIPNEVLPHLAAPQTSGEIINHLVQGDPLLPQIRGLTQNLPGGFEQNGSGLLRDAFQQYATNFRSTAEAIINNPGNYSADQLSVARDQLAAINQLQSNPGIDPASNQGLNLFIRAMHYWRP